MYINHDNLLLGKKEMKRKKKGRDEMLSIDRHSDFIYYYEKKILVTFFSFEINKWGMMHNLLKLTIYHFV